MRRILAAVVFSSALPLAAAEPCITLDNKSVAALFDDWNFALSSLDANQVSQRYWPDAVMLPTASNAPSTSPAMIGDYFKRFLAKRPRGRIDTRTIQSGCNLAVDMGTYTFSLMDDKGSTSEESARYTFVYQYRDGAWKILHQHSSAMPESVQAGTPDASDAKGAADPAAAVKLAKRPEPVEPLSRRERRAMLKEAALQSANKVKPAEKGTEAKRAAGVKPAGEPKVTATAKAAPDTRAADAKVGDAKAGEAKLADPKASATTVADAKSATDAKASAATTPADAKAADAKVAATSTAPIDGKIPPEVRTAMFANLTLSPPPANFYPPEARRRKEHGSVNLKVCADGNGAVSDSMEVVKSSGSKLLDDAAMTWARAVTWVPATYNRQRVEGCAKVDVFFEPPPDLAHARP